MVEATETARGPEQGRVQDVWAPAPTVDPEKLDDAHLRSYRHPGEGRTLLATAVIVVIVGVALVPLQPYLRQAFSWAPRPIVETILSTAGPLGFVAAVLIVLLVAGAATVLQMWLQSAQVTADAVEITATTFPALYPTVEELRRRFALPRTRVFVYEGTREMSSAFGVLEPYMIVFSPSLLRMVKPAESKFRLGHEMGHIKLGHTRTAALLGGGHLKLPSELAILGKLRNLITASYQRAQELSCDRIGVLATHDVSPAVSLNIRMSIGRVKGGRIDVPSLTEQASEAVSGGARIGSSLLQLSKPEPLLVDRVREITRWAGLPAEEEDDDEDGESRKSKPKRDRAEGPAGAVDSVPVRETVRRVAVAEVRSEART